MDSIGKKIQTCEKIYGEKCSTSKSSTVSDRGTSSSTIAKCSLNKTSTLDGGNVRFESGSVQNCNIFIISETPKSELSVFMR